MKNKIIFLLIFLAIIGSGILLSNSSNKKTNSTSGVVQQPINKTQVNEKGAVTVEVTPKTLIADQQAVFEIQFNTHSVDLNYDIASLAQITDDKGNTYEPTSWTGGKGGHHLEGILTFPAIGKSQKVTLTIRGIDNQDRIFSWNM